MERLREMEPDQVAWVVAGILLALVALVVVWHAIGALVFGVFLYYALRSLNERIDSVIDNDDASAVLTMVLFGIPLIVVLVWAGLVVYQAVTDLLGGAGLAQVRAALQPYVNVSRLTDPRRLLELYRNNAGTLGSYAGTIFMWGVRLTISVIVTFYLLRDDDRIADWFRDSFGEDDDVVEFMRNVDSELDTIYTGNLITMLVNGLLAVVVFSTFDLAVGRDVVGYPVVLGLLVGVFTLVPAVGVIMVYFPYTLYLLARAFVWETLPKWIPFAFFAVTFVFVDVTPDYFIRAVVSGRNLNVGLMMLAFVFGSLAFGWYGIFLGPILLVVLLHFARHVFPRIVQGWPDASPAGSD